MSLPPGRGPLSLQLKDSPASTTLTVPKGTSPMTPTARIAILIALLPAVSCAAADTERSVSDIPATIRPQTTQPAPAGTAWETIAKIVVLIGLPLAWGMGVELISDRVIGRHRHRRNRKEPSRDAGVS